MADQILLTNIPGEVTWSDEIPLTGSVVGSIQAFGNFPRDDQNVDEPGNHFEPAVQYSRDGAFQFSGYDVSAGQSVLFDIAQGPHAAYATNVRVP
jgi:hypothetical protein